MMKYRQQPRGSKARKGIMIYGNDYEGCRRECDSCGHFTNVHTYCDACETTVCERCEDHHTCIKQEVA